MDSISHIDGKLKRILDEMKQLIKKQNNLLGELNSAIDEKGTQILPLIRTVENLIKHGLSKDEILEITNISSEQYEVLLAKKKFFQLPYIYLNEQEKIEYGMLIQDIQKAANIYELIDSSKEGERIVFIHKVLGRYLREYKRIKDSDEDVYDTFIERIILNGNAKSAYLALVRIFGNEIKRKREEILITSTSE